MKKIILILFIIISINITITTFADTIQEATGKYRNYKLGGNPPLDSGFCLESDLQNLKKIRDNCKETHDENYCFHNANGKCELYIKKIIKHIYLKITYILKYLYQDE